MIWIYQSFIYFHNNVTWRRSILSIQNHLHNLLCGYSQHQNIVCICWNIVQDIHMEHVSRSILLNVTNVGTLLEPGLSMLQNIYRSDNEFTCMAKRFGYFVKPLNVIGCFLFLYNLVIFSVESFYWHILNCLNRINELYQIWS